jgi:hypothetical protein
MTDIKAAPIDNNQRNQMKPTTSVYINQLNFLQLDLSNVMQTWPAGPSFDIAKQHANAIAPLIAGQVQTLQNSIRLNPCDPLALRSEVENLTNTLPCWTLLLLNAIFNHQQSKGKSCEQIRPH